MGNVGVKAGGPSGITAQVKDVLEGKVFGTGGSGKATGTLADLGHSQAALAVAEETADLAFACPAGAFTASAEGYDSPVVRSGKAAVRSAIGLTAAKLLAGNTVLGLAGSGKSIVAVYAMAAGAWTGPIVAASVKKTNIDTSILNDTVVKKAGRFQVVRLSGGTTDNWTTWPALSRGVGTHTLKVGDTITVKTTGEAQNGYMPICLFYVVYLGA